MSAGGAPSLRHRVHTVWVGPAVPIACAAVAAVVFFGYALSTYLSFHATAYDLGFFDQVVENNAAGRWWQSTFVPYSFLGQHWEPILLLPNLLDRLAPTPIWLLLLQAVPLAAAPIFGWRLARAWSLPEAAPLAALACLADPLLNRGAAFAFHPEALTPVLALAALDAGARGRRLGLLLPALALALVKEDALLVCAGVGWISWRVDRRQAGLALIAAGSALAIGIVGVVMPRIRGAAASDLVERYSYLGGDTIGAIARAAVLHPDRVISHLVSNPDLHGWAVAFGPLALLPLLAGWALLAPLAPLLVALLSADTGQAALDYHYGLESFPLLLACALLGWRRITGATSASASAGPAPADAPPRRARFVAAVLGGGLVLGHVIASPLPGGLAYDGSAFSGLGRYRAVAALLATIPPDAEVAATSGLVPHLSNRAGIWEFPSGLGVAWVAIDRVGVVSRQSIAVGYDAKRDALPEEGYRLVAAADGVEIWTRTS